MKVSYVSLYDAMDIHSFSGTAYYIGKMLEEQNAEVDYIDKLKTRSDLSLRVKRKVYELLNKSFRIDRELSVARYYAEQIQTRMSPKTDILFTSPNTAVFACLDTNKPKVLYSDATFWGFVESYYNTNFSDSEIAKVSLRHGKYLEKKTLEACDLIIYSSDWAAQTAIDHYNINPDKIKVVPFGANISCNRNFDDIKGIENNRSKKTLNLLFIGVDWNRKGGDFAVKVAKALNDAGIKTTLNIVGIKKLPFDTIPDYIINHGYVSKRTPEGMNYMEQLFIDNHFLLLPSVADCTPIVYSEANSFGLPCITTNVGGITTIIKDNINGKTFSIDASVDEWCKYILNAFIDKTKYKSFCLSSFNEYQTRLNWTVAGKSIMNLLKDI